MDEEEFDSYVKAGKIAGKALHYGKSLIKEGALLLDVTEKVEEYILKNGGNFAFPAQINRNETAAHYCCPADDKTAFEHGDIIKIDCGVHINGFVADNALTVVLSNDQKLKLLSEATKSALKKALTYARPGVKTNEIGKVIEEEIKSRGFNPIINLSGHGLAKYVIHDSPNIPNFAAPSGVVLRENQPIAIEPFASTGAGMIFESSNPTVHALEELRPTRSPITKEVLKTIQTYNGLPFAQRWLVKKHGLGKTMFALRELRANGSLNDYPSLPDSSHGMVSQHEHTVIVRDKPVVTTLFDED